MPRKRTRAQVSKQSSAPAKRARPLRGRRDKPSSAASQPSGGASAVSSSTTMNETDPAWLSSRARGKNLEGAYVHIFWDKDQLWHRALVSKYKDRKHLVIYDKTNKARKKQEWKTLDVRAGRRPTVRWYNEANPPPQKRSSKST